MLGRWLPRKALPCQHEGWRPGPQYPYECQTGIVACETSCIGGLGVQVRNPASLYVVESDWGRNRMSTSGLHTHMHTHLSTYINIHANMHIFHTQMTKMSPWVGLTPLHSCGGWKSEASGWPGWSHWGCERYSVPCLFPRFTDAHLPSVCLLRDPLWRLHILVTFRKMPSTNAATFWGREEWGLRSWGQETIRALQPLSSHLEHGTYHGM